MDFMIWRMKSVEKSGPHDAVRARTDRHTREDDAAAAAATDWNCVINGKPQFGQMQNWSENQSETRTVYPRDWNFQKIDLQQYYLSFSNFFHISFSLFLFSFLPSLFMEMAAIENARFLPPDLCNFLSLLSYTPELPIESITIHEG